MTAKTDPRGLGVLLQVAFKGAVDASPDPGAEAIYALTKSYFKVLTTLGDEFDLEFTFPKGGGGGYGGKGGGGPRKASPKQGCPKVSVDIFGDGKPIEFADQRGLKADGTYSVKAPDFSSIEKFDLKGTGDTDFVPIWLVDQNGVYNTEAAELLVAAGVDLSEDNEPSAAAKDAASVDVSRF